MSDLADPAMDGEYPHDLFQKFGKVAALCLLASGDNRPEMKEVTAMLATIESEMMKREEAVRGERTSGEEKESGED